MAHNKHTQPSRSGWKRRAALFLLLCVLALLWTVPAGVLPKLLATTNTSPVVLIDRTSGSLWSGQAQRVLITTRQQQFVLENVNWRFDWRSLFNLQLCLDIDSSPAAADAIRFDGKSCFAPSGAIRLSDLSFELPAATLVAAQLQNSPLMRTLDSAVQVEGEIAGVIDLLHWHAEQLQQLDAQGAWLGAAITMQLPDAETFRMRQRQLRLGAMPWSAALRDADRLFLHLRSAETGLTDTDMQIDSQSDIWLDGRYTTQLDLQLVPSTPPFLRDIIAIVAQHQGGGTYRLEWRNLPVLSVY